MFGADGRRRTTAPEVSDARAPNVPHHHSAIAVLILEPGVLGIRHVLGLGRMARQYELASGKSGRPRPGVRIAGYELLVRQPLVSVQMRASTSTSSLLRQQTPKPRGATVLLNEQVDD
jgi:hypothetical protein